MHPSLVRLQSLTIDDFSGLVGQPFDVSDREEGPAATQLVLAEVTEGRQILEGFRKPFALLFHGPADLAIGQGNLWFTHQSIGTIPIFIVPIGADSEMRQYEALFN